MAVGLKISEARHRNGGESVGVNRHPYSIEAIGHGIMLKLCRRFLYWFALKVYFARVTVLNRERLPSTGPVLFLGLHRNGAVDGLVYDHALRRPTPMVSTQLRKSWFARLFFTGIAVTRKKDEGERERNAAALQECISCLRAGQSLLVFPEGTSSLGPRHLPFKAGAAWLVIEYLKKGGPPLQVVPVGIHYECAWSFRAKVEVVIGGPVNIALPNGMAPHAQLKELKRRFETELEKVGVNVSSSDYQEKIQGVAYVSTLATPRSYFATLKALEAEIPMPILEAGSALETELQSKRLLLHQGIPLAPMGSVWIYVFALLLLAPIVLGAIVLNLPPFLAGWLAGEKFPDDLNVISLWKILVGIPVFLLWICIVSLLCLWNGELIGLLGYAVLTWLGLILYYRAKKLAVAVHNGLRYPRLRTAMFRFRETVLQNLPVDGYVN
jgi:1-acyl-sn-glycerol-3-phosphate acyltransferase